MKTYSAKATLKRMLTTIFSMAGVSLCAIAADQIDDIDVADVASYAGVSGGDYAKLIYENGKQYVVHVFTNTSSSATLTVNSDNTIVPGSVRLLVVGGGGSGGWDCGGGGGGGGVVISNDMSLAVGDYTVTVGAGGAAGSSQSNYSSNGGESSISYESAKIYQALGGGGGGWGAGREGGSSGGSGRGNSTIVAAKQPSNTISPGYGSAGGRANGGYHGGGGGGAGGAGGAATGDNTSSVSGNGGDGIACDITGEEVYYAGGGGGGGNYAASNIAYESAGGKGGGGRGAASAKNSANTTKMGEDGVDGLGGGGGGGPGDTGRLTSGKGGSGIVAIRYEFTNSSTTPVALMTSAEVAAMGGASSENCAWIRKVTNDDGSMTIVHCWTNTTSAGSLKFGNLTSVIDGSGRFAVIGGGGAGGPVNGGGGGAGGVVTNVFDLTTDTYQITVGAGGAAAAYNGNRQAASGTDSSITNTTAGTAVAWALGGGGGGAQQSNYRNGRAGGSGGGGNRDGKGAAALQGDTANGYPDGLGHKGGDAGNTKNTTNRNYAGGGGGAGSDGTKGHSDGYVGQGGDGIELDISGFSRWYAGGGGGGTDDESVIGLGGSGVGGTGGVSSNSVATAGVDGTGSGGGGAGPTAAGAKSGKGGDGVVFISYSIRGGEATPMEDGSVLYKFTESAPFTLDGAALVRVLAVGGGGAGGSGTYNVKVLGGNGGGGAGGFVDVTNVWRGTTYTVTVGDGGVPTSTPSAGPDGGNTKILNGEEEIIVALGGGGGGCRTSTAGRSGGSGGGSARNGTAGATSQNSTYGYGFGNAGGTSTVNQYGGGGGGAGGIGGSLTSGTQGGAGGLGKESDITGEPLYYAAGGGGSGSAAGGIGGSGIGGNGGYGSNSAGSGLDGTGSGGGGGSGSSGQLGGAGGSGIVYIRLIRMMPKKPLAEYSREFNNEEYVAYALAEGDEEIVSIVTGDNITTNRIAATEQGTYTYTVALTDAARAKGYVWFDGTTDTINVTLTISKTITVINSIHQDGWQIGETRPALQVSMKPEGVPYTLQYSDSEDGEWSDTLEMTPGVHYMRMVVEESDNYTACTSSVTSFRLWEYVNGKYPDYLGYHSDIDVSATASVSGSRLVRVAISEGTPVGFSYDKAQEDGSDVRFTYADSVSGEIVIVPHVFDNGWNVGGETVAWVSVPAGVESVTMNWGLLEDKEVPDPADASGIWDNVDRPDAMFESSRVYHAAITVTNYTGAALTDFPMALRIAAGSPAGFRYSDAAPDGSDLVFALSDGTTMAYEIEKWDSSGDSLVWVKVPTYQQGAKFYMHWGKKADVTIPASTEVWSAYAGVWHMTGANDSAAGASAGTVGNKATSVDGIFGGALAANEQGEPLILATASEAVNGVTNGSFTVSFYTKYNDESRGTAAQYLFSRRKVLGDAGYALCINSPRTSGASQFIICFGESSGRYTTNDSTPMSKSGSDKWVRNDVVYTSNRFYWYVNGEELYWSRDMSAGFSNGTTGLLGIGGLAASGSDSNINGAMDEFRIYSGTPNATLIAAETNQWQAIAAGGGTFDWGSASIVTPASTDVMSPTVVTPESKFVNRWVSLGSVSPIEWYEGQTTTINPGSAAYGTVHYVFNGANGSATTDAIPTAAGLYEVVFFVEAGEFGTCRYSGLTYTFPDQVNILAHSQGVGGFGTLSGRVLLANDDLLEDYEISGQSYWQTNPDDPDADTYWVHEDGASLVLMPTMHRGIINTLKAREPVEDLCGATNIWHLDNVRIGNTYANNLYVSNEKNFLPWSSTSKVLAEDGSGYINTTTATNSVNLAIRSIAGAAVYSPCYTNGIGTIYFDAVNGWVADETYPTNYTIVVEFATNCVESVGADKIPTDANLYETWEEEQGDDTVEVSGIKYANANWQPIKMTPLFFDGTEFQTSVKHGFGSVTNSFDGPVESLALDVSEGGRHDQFYRVYVPVLEQLNGYRGPIRFRIKRVTTKGVGADNNNFILIDNLIVSYPAMTANLAPSGKFDVARYGKQALGTECAFDVPFPAVGDSIKGIASVSYETNSLVSNPDPSTFVTSAKLHYRWRYLNQASNDWASVAIIPNTWKTVAPLDLSSVSGLPGDVEYWYELFMNAPYYAYTDYSGLGLEDKLAELYSENIPVVTNRCDMGILESAGTDWFVRLREGKSPYEELQVVLCIGDETTTNSMEIIKDNTWRGYVQTFTNKTGAARFQIRALNRQVEDSGEFVENVKYWAAGAVQEKMPISTAMPDDGTEDSWTEFTVDAKTGYLMFQVDDNTRSLSVVHADYQNFNLWSDAHKDYFVGNSTANDKKSGSSSTKVSVEQDFETWSNLPTTDNDWVTADFASGTLGHTTYTPFASDVDPNGWEIGKGQWVAKQYRDETKGIALQMAGEGLGKVEFSNTVNMPRGIEKVSLAARVAQSMNIDNFCTYWGDNASSMSNYTFCAAVKMTADGKDNFTGDGSVSLVANYQYGRGCYEFRVVRTAKEKVQLQLYKWTGRKSQLLGSVEHGIIKPGTTGNSNECGLMDTSTTKYARMSISVSNRVDGVMVSAAITRNQDNGTAAQNNTISGKNHLSVTYLDTSSPYRKGAYGVGSASCPAVFSNPSYYEAPLMPWITGGSPKTNASYPGFTYSNSSYSMNYPSATLVRCLNTEADYDDWTWDGVRIVTGKAGTYNAFLAGIPTQDVLLMTREPGGKTWLTNAVVNVNSFSSGNTTNVYLRLPKDSLFKAVTGGTDGDESADIVVDSVRLYQWRGADWNVDDADLRDAIPGYAGESSSGYNPSNFVFYSAWITNTMVNGASDQALLLSARRTIPGKSAAIKSPLLDGYSGRGRGVGMISFDYANAQENAVLEVQVATNNVGTTTMSSINSDDSAWETVETISFAGLSAAERRKGVRSVYFGLHGVAGWIRIRVSPDLVESVANETDPSKFGEIFITSVRCTDEPDLDDSSWWGWNIRAIGDTGDSEGRMFLPDRRAGMSMALNNSTNDVLQAELAEYKANMPFVQSPTFGTNLVGEVLFRARKFGYDDEAVDSQDAYVTLYGAKDSSATSWEKISDFCVSNKIYQTYSYKVEPGTKYYAFRFAVQGAEGIIGQTPHYAGHWPGEGSAVRVLIDEALVTEAIEAKVSFRNVGAFRGNPMARNNIMRDLLIVPLVPSEFEQPLCEEAWGVQCEVYKELLPDEIDFETHPPVVYLHYFRGISPWGFDNWKANAAAKVCRLDLAEDSTDTNLVFRSSYVNGVDNVLPVVPASDPLAKRVYQYSLQVVYYQTGSTRPMTNTLDLAQWGGNPAWYRGIDFNNQYGAGKEDNFAAYCVFDTIAPGWAWINEVNIYASEGESTSNLEKNKQFVELAVPSEADISGWKFKMLWSDQGNDAVITNTAAVFGNGPGQIPGMKAGLVGQASNMVFRTIGSPLSKSTGELVDYGGESGTLDGTWSWNYNENPDIASKLTYDEAISPLTPIGFQLVRPSGIIEHEVVAIGNDWWADTTYYTYQPTNTVNYLNKMMPGSRFFYVGNDQGGLGCSLNVFDSRGESVSVWTNQWVLTPGRINRDADGNPQKINANHPIPNGDTVIVYCTLDTETSGDRLLQSINNAAPTNVTQIVYLTKGSEVGLTITYTADPWFELTSVTTNSLDGASAPVPFEAVAGLDRTWKATVGVNASNSFTVVAMPTLKPNIGVDPSDRYYNAMVKWLSDQTRADGSPWKNPGCDTVYPVKFYKMGDGVTPGDFVTNLTVRYMYWLDLDPTDGPNASYEDEEVNNTVMLGYISSPTVVPRSQGTLNNLQVGVSIVFTNGVDGTAWAPNVLRGLAPDETSWNTSVNNWTSETFKVTGMILNGRTSVSDPNCFVPLRWFVFKQNSFDEDFTSKIEIIDPYSPASVGYPQWKRSLSEQWSVIGLFWMLDDRGSNVGVEELKETNTYNYNE